MILLYPIALLLALPLGAALWAWGARSRWLIGLRSLTFTLVIGAVAGLCVRLPSRAGTVVVLADRSRSMPADAEASQQDAIRMLEGSMTAEDRLMVVSFGEKATAESTGETKFAGFASEVGRDASNLGEAMDKALALAPRGGPSRMLVLSDGQWTGKDPRPSAMAASERNIPIDYRLLQRKAGDDTAIAQVEAPTTVYVNESFLIAAWVRSPTAQDVAYELRRGDLIVARGKKTLEPGVNRLTFRDQASQAGTQAYALTIETKEPDAVPENNRARFLVGVEGAKPLLVVPSSDKSKFADLLKAGGVPVAQKSAEACRWSLEELSNYSGVILENVPADRIGLPGMETLAAWVQQAGTGLMVTGGRASFGSGGYFKSPLDPLLPVSMELRQEHRKLSLAIVVALDRSGSMAESVGGGRVKMDLANLGAAQVVDLLSPSDEFGCIAIDSAPHTIQPLGQLSNRSEVRNRILKINSEGGGIYIYEALEASIAMLKKGTAGTRHIILFSDAADAEEPKQYKKLLKECNDENISVSVIGLGKASDKDGELLKDIASRGRGRVFFTDRADDLPRLFAQDTFVVARSAFLDEQTPFKTTAGVTTIASRDYQPLPLGGYNLTYLRPQANLAAVTLDGYKAPVLAAWQSGAGRVLAYSGEVDGKHTGPMAGWKDVGDFYSSMARWTLGRPSALPEGMTATLSRRKGLASLCVRLDPARTSDPFTKLPEASILRGVPGEKPRQVKLPLRWADADTLEVDTLIVGTETVLPTLHWADRESHPLPPICLPYSPEYEPAPLRAKKEAGDESSMSARWGESALDEMARLTGGRERLDLAHVWSELPRSPRLIPLAPWLLAIACAVFLLEVLQRLTGILSRGSKLPAATAGSPRPTIAVSASRPAAAVETQTVPGPAATEAPAVGGVLAALRQVQKNAPRNSDS